MPRLLFSIIFLITTCIHCVIPTYMGKSTLSETEVKKSPVNYSGILLVGAGSTASRLFLENLSTEIEKLFAKNKIQSDFTYLGKIPRSSFVDLSKVVTSKYNAYLVFTPMDTSSVDTHKSVAMVGIPLPGGYSTTGSMIGNQYREDYYVELYTNNDSLKRVWQGKLKVDFDFATTNKYQKIANDIFDKLLKNGFIPKG